MINKRGEKETENPDKDRKYQKLWRIMNYRCLKNIHPRQRDIYVAFKWYTQSTLHTGLQYGLNSLPSQYAKKVPGFHSFHALVFFKLEAPTPDRGSGY